MTELTYCPKCGKQTLLWDGSNKWSCSNCDFVLYHNCAAAVAVVIRCKDEIFFTRRNRDPQKGKLDLSGGFTDPKESAEYTCKRELEEELSIHIHPEKLKFLATQPNVYHYKGIDYNTLDLFYEYEVEEKFVPKLEVSEIAAGIWYKISEIPIEEISFESQKTFFKNYIECIENS